MGGISKFFGFVKWLTRRADKVAEWFADFSFIFLTNNRFGSAIQYIIMVALISLTFYYIVLVVKIVIFIIHLKRAIFSDLNGFAYLEIAGFPFGKIVMATMILPALKVVIDLFLPFFILVFYSYFLYYTIKMYRSYYDLMGNLPSFNESGGRILDILKDKTKSVFRRR